MKTRRVGRAAWLPLTGILLSLACAGRGVPTPAAPAPAPVLSDRSSPELDFLIARQLELEGRLPESLAAYQAAAGKDPDAPYLHRKLSQLSARQGDLAGALEHAERAYELDPASIDTRLLLGTLYRVRKDPAAAERILRTPDGDPLDERAAFLLYTIYVESESFDQALATAQWIVEENPDSLRGWFALAGVYEHRGQPEEVERALREALSRDPGNLAVYNALARARRSRGDRAGEIEVHREILERFPHHRATLTDLADAQISMGRTEDAIATLEDVVRYHPEDVRSAVRLSLLEYETGRYERAGERLEAALESNPEEHEVAYLLGLVRQRRGEDDAALVAFERVPPEHRNYAEARTQMAVIHESRGQYATALAEVERARGARPTRPLDLYAASLRAKTGDFAAAVAFLEVLLEDTPQDDDLLYNLGVLHGEAGQYDQAMVYMQRALDLNPDNAAALNYVGYTWAERGENLDQAEAYITRALELRPDDGFITDSLAWVYYMRAKPMVESGTDQERVEGRRLLEKALRNLKKADELTGGDPVIAEHIGDVYLLLDDKPRALEFYRDAIAQEPRAGEQPDLMRKFERLRQELGVQ